MTISKLPLPPHAARLLGAAALLLSLSACEPHDAEEARAFYDPHYEEQLHEEKLIPRGHRLYYEGAPFDPVQRTNTANPANYTSIFRGNDRVYPENKAKDSHFPAPEHEGVAAGEHEAAAGEGQASPPKTMFPEKEGQH